MSPAAALLAAIALRAGEAPPAAAAGEGPARPAPLSLLVRAERTEARLGEPFDYEIEVRHPREESYTLPGDLDLPPFRGAARGCVRAEAGGEARTTCRLSLALFALGAHDVPEVRLAVRGPAGEASLAVPGPRVTGVGIIDPAAAPEHLALRDPAPPVPLLVPSLRVLLWAAGALAAAALLALLVRARRRARTGAAPPPPPEPPSVRLRRRLDALEARDLPARGLGREHVFEVSEIVREWVAAVTGVNALELTTAELVGRLRGETSGGAAGPGAAGPVASLGLEVEALRRFCERADLVKYARAPAGPADCAAATAFARALGGAPFAVAGEPARRGEGAAG